MLQRKKEKKTLYIAPILSSSFQICPSFVKPKGSDACRNQNVPIPSFHNFKHMECRILIKTSLYEKSFKKLFEI